MVQDQGSCHCNPLEAASELQFRGALSGMVLFIIYVVEACIINIVANLLYELLHIYESIQECPPIL